MMPVVVSAYTRGTGYEQEVTRLKKSVLARGLAGFFQGSDPRGSWQENVAFKSDFITAMARYHPTRSLLWLDADAELLQSPDLLRDCRVDLGYVQLTSGEVMGCAIYLGNPPHWRVIPFLEAWRSACHSDYSVIDQLHMQRLLAEAAWATRLSRLLLPLTYCKFFDQELLVDQQPVVEQFQASRRLAKAAGYYFKHGG
jgi:hypothetical protein